MLNQYLIMQKIEIFFLGYRHLAESSHKNRPPFCKLASRALSTLIYPIIFHHFQIRILILGRLHKGNQFLSMRQLETKLPAKREISNEL